MFKRYDNGRAPNPFQFRIRPVLVLFWYSTLDTIHSRKKTNYYYYLYSYVSMSAGREQRLIANHTWYVLVFLYYIIIIVIIERLCVLFLPCIALP